MAKDYTALIANVRRRAQLSQDSGQSISDNDILAFASDELQNVIGPKIYATRGWHYACQTPFALTSVRNYRIPQRAAGGTIISVEIVNTTPPNRKINYIHPMQTTGNQQQMAEYYYIWGNTIVISDGSPTSGTMIVRHLLAPSAVYTKGTSTISINDNFSADYTSTELNLVDGVSGFVDFVRSDSPYEVVMAQVPANTAGGIISFGGPVFLQGSSAQSTYGTVDNFSADLSTLMSGTRPSIRVVDAGLSPYPMLNDEFHDFLAQRTAMRCMEAIGHTEDLTNMTKKLSDLESAFLRAISPRERGDIKVILAEDFYYDRRF